jgi:hypothetical protein
MKINEKALEILRATSDGSNLAPRDLSLLQAAVNGDLSEKGIEVFNELYEQVMAGTYDKNKVYYYGVEHMTKDCIGYIYYKGKLVEHYSYRNSAEEITALKRLQARCVLLEAKGVEVDTATAVFEIEKYLSPEEIINIDNQFKIAA